MLLTGTFRRSVDETLRLAVPMRLRIGLGQGGGTALFVAPGTDGSLVVYSEPSFERLAERLARASPTRKDVRAFSRLFYAQAERVKIDGQGRVRIPRRLAQIAELGREAVLLGVQDHMELWDAQRWEMYLARHASRYDEIAEAAFSDPEG